MKKFVVLMMGLVASSMAVAAEPGLVSYISDAHVVSARLETGNGGINPRYTRIDVYATVQFGNLCEESDLAVESTSKDPSRATYRLVQVTDRNKNCTMEFRPVTREVLVDSLFTDIMPIVKVNGVAAKLQR